MVDINELADEIRAMKDAVGLMPKDGFFRDMRKIGLAYSDAILIPDYSEVMPDHVSLKSRFSRNIGLNIPLVSSPMDTVTEHRMAIELARGGGIGIIHRNMTPERQASEVAQTKYAVNGRIDRPKCVFENDTIESILKRKEEKDYHFSSFPVLDREGRLAGILTETDFKFCEDYSLPAREVMTKNVITGNENTSAEEAYDMIISTRKSVIPLVAKDRKVEGMYTLSDIRRARSGNLSNYNVDRNGQFVVAAAIGVYDYERLEKLIAENVDAVVIDTAHGDSRPVIETLKEIKRMCSRLDVIAGNVSNPESARRMAAAGADGIRVGQGVGGICTTSVISGAGFPQLSAVYLCSRAVRGSDVPICADGGLEYSGDITKAIAAGAHCVMMGKLLAGTEESPAKIVHYQGRKYKRYRGMGSIEAMEEHACSRGYSQKDTGKSELIAEGVSGLVPYIGELNKAVFQYMGGLRKGMGLVGAADIEELRKKVDFEKVLEGGQRQSHAHGVMITEEPPNYPIK